MILHGHPLTAFALMIPILPIAAVTSVSPSPLVCVDTGVAMWVLMRYMMIDVRTVLVWLDIACNIVTFIVLHK